jgi:hypothetical protein
MRSFGLLVEASFAAGPVPIEYQIIIMDSSVYLFFSSSYTI